MKICCISSIEELGMAIEYGAAAVGLVSQMPSGPGVIADELIALIAGRVPPLVSSFLLTCQQKVRAIVEQQRRAGVSTIQLCDRLESGSHRELRRALPPGVAIVQVVHIAGGEALEEACAVAPFVNGILLDSGNRESAIKELGGTGRTHDWEISRRIREAVSVPVWLAGGLNAANVAAAIRQVEPFGVDVCSGVRTGGKLDEAKLANFFRSVENA